MTTKATTQQSPQAVGPKNDESKAVEFVPFGAKDSIRLTASLVRQFIAVPTRSGSLPSERDCIRFIMLCRGKRANPFEGDCFLIGYDSQNGPTFSLVCGVELFLKRAEASDDYDGNENGVIVSGEDGAVIERPGALVLQGETILGGWAKVYRKNRRMPEVKQVKFETYSTGRSRWEKDPGGMIAKVALSQALRSAYPTALGGLYTQEEMERVTELGGSVVEARKEIAMPTPKAATQESPEQNQPAEPGSTTTDAPAVATEPPSPATEQPPVDPVVKAITDKLAAMTWKKALAARTAAGVDKDTPVAAMHKDDIDRLRNVLDV